MPTSKCTICGRQCWTCRKCNNRTYCEFCNSCNLHGQDEPAPHTIRPPRGPGGRLFLVQVAFETARGWTTTFDIRVRSKGVAGAAWKGLREARRTHLKRGTRVSQVRLTVLRA